jgi:hypothetical protein
VFENNEPIKKKTTEATNQIERDRQPGRDFLGRIKLGKECNG